MPKSSNWTLLGILVRVSFGMFCSLIQLGKLLERHCRGPGGTKVMGSKFEWIKSFC